MRKRRCHVWQGCYTRLQPVVTIGALILWIVWLIVLSIIGSPRLLLYLISVRIPAVPSWIFILLSSLFFLVSGGCLGELLGGGKRISDAIRYRGAFFATVAVTLCYLWYALFFGVGFFLPALILAAISDVCFFAAAASVRRVFSFAGVGFWICFGIDLYFVFLSLLCFLMM